MPLFFFSIHPHVSIVRSLLSVVLSFEAMFKINVFSVPVNARICNDRLFVKCREITDPNAMAATGVDGQTLVGCLVLFGVPGLKYSVAKETLNAVWYSSL
jgi:hypothetical protein